MVVNFRTRETSRDVYNVVRIPILIKKGSLASVMIREKATITLKGCLEVQFIINQHHTYDKRLQQ
jgi:hypothetical protein